MNEKRHAVAEAYENALKAHQEELDAIDGQLKDVENERQRLFAEREQDRKNDRALGYNNADNKTADEHDVEAVKNGDVHYRLGDGSDTFEERQRKAVAAKGIVMPRLNNASVNVVELDRVSNSLCQF